MNRSILAIALTAVISLSMASRASAEYFYGFAGGSTQGWTIGSETTPFVGRSLFVVVDAPWGGGAVDGYCLSNDVGGDTGNFETGDATSTRTAKSPTFYLDGTNNSITALLMGGGHGATTISSPLPATSTGTGFNGIALYDVTADSYVGFASKTLIEGTTSPVNWANDQVSIATTGLNLAHVYSLHLIDQYWGGYGWICLDDVHIPGVASPVPEPSTVALLVTGLVGLLACAWRKRK